MPDHCVYVPQLHTPAPSSSIQLHSPGRTTPTKTPSIHPLQDPKVRPPKRPTGTRPNWCTADSDSGRFLGESVGSLSPGSVHRSKALHRAKIRKNDLSPRRRTRILASGVWGFRTIPVLRQSGVVHGASGQNTSATPARMVRLSLLHFDHPTGPTTTTEQDDVHAGSLADRRTSRSPKPENQENANHPDAPFTAPGPSKPYKFEGPAPTERRVQGRVWADVFFTGLLENLPGLLKSSL